MFLLYVNQRISFKNYKKNIFRQLNEKNIFTNFDILFNNIAAMNNQKNLFLYLLYATLITMLLCVGCQTSGREKDQTVPFQSTEKKYQQPEKEVPKITSQPYSFAWIKNYNINNAIINRIAVPVGYTRVTTTKDTYADWLRFLPLKEGHPKVRLYNGQLKGNQSAQHSVLDIDVGNEDLQQCADAVMRLRAEYLWSIEDFHKIHFNFTSGDEVAYERWKQGFRPIINGNNVRMERRANTNNSYNNFKAYLKSIYTYAGTASLSKELKPVKDLQNIRAGDVFIQGGFPGHAVTVMDVATNGQSGEKIFLLSQSYMPAQDIHILNNPDNQLLSPWYSSNFTGDLQTPEWTFQKNDLKRFAD